MKLKLLTFLALMPIVSSAYTLGNNSYITTTIESVTVKTPVVYAMPGMVYTNQQPVQQNVVNQNMMMQRPVVTTTCGQYPQQNMVVPMMSTPVYNTTPVVQTPTTVVIY
jgi:hypothetical protein